MSSSVPFPPNVVNKNLNKQKKQLPLGVTGDLQRKFCELQPRETTNTAKVPMQSNQRKNLLQNVAAIAAVQKQMLIIFSPTNTKIAMCVNIQTKPSEPSKSVEETMTYKPSLMFETFFERRRLTAELILERNPSWRN